MTTPDDLAEHLGLHSDPAEMNLLGSVVRHPDAMAHILAALPGKDFFRMERGVVWDACRAMSDAREPIDPVSIARWLAAHDQWEARSLNGNVRRVVQSEMTLHGSDLSVTMAAKYAEQVAEYARRRELVYAATRMRQLAVEHPGTTSEALASVRAHLDDLDRDAPTTVGPLGWDALIREFEDVHAPGGSRPGIPSPWWQLDALIGGLFAGRMYVFGGRPGQGKSTAALNIALHAAVESDKQSLIISREMPTVDVTGRLLAAGAEVPLQKINARTLDDLQRQRIRDYVKRVGRLPITVDAKPRGLAGILTLARAHAHRHGLDILVVDYLQLIRNDNPGRNREQEVAEVSRRLKELSLELDCVVVLPAQLNRESTKRSDQRPNMSDLRDSGQIEQDSDAIALLHREQTPDGLPTGKILLIVDKNRHGPTGEVKLDWHGGYGSIA